MKNKSMKNKILPILKDFFISFVIYFLISSALNAQELADLIEKVTPAVVNISSEQVVKQESNDKIIKNFPRDDFFGEFRKFFDQFDKFFTDKTPRTHISLGSGFIIDKDGIIVTNYHVIQNAREITVTMNDATDYFKAEVLGYDSQTDLAVLKINSDKPLPYVSFGDSSHVRVGDSVIAVGNPFGLGGSVSTGIISAKSRDISVGSTGLSEFIQTDAAINKGNSGGPLFNLNGEVIGMNTAIFSPYEYCGNIGIGFAIPSNAAVPIIDILKSGKKVKHGLLGVQVQPLTRDIAESLNIKDVVGILVADVVKDSPADKAGIRPGDILIEFDSNKINRITQLVQMVLRTEPKRKVQIKLFRNGKEINVKAIIGELINHDQGNSHEEDQSKTDYIIGYTVADLSRDSTMKKGVIVVNVDSSSHAAQRVQKGDIIIQVNGVDIANTHDFNKQIDISIKKNVNSVLLLIYRNGQQFFTAVKLRSK